jgi:hypothetical protein
MEAYNTFLQNLATLLEFPVKQLPDAEALLIVLRGSNVTVQMEIDHDIQPGSILIFSKVLDVPAEVTSSILIALLKGNDEGHEILSYNVEEQAVYLHRRLHPLIPVNELNLLITHFEKAVVRWRDFLAKYLEEQTVKIPLKNFSPSEQTKFKA